MPLSRLAAFVRFCAISRNIGFCINLFLLVQIPYSALVQSAFAQTSLRNADIIRLHNQSNPIPMIDFVEYAIDSTRKRSVEGIAQQWREKQGFMRPQSKGLSFGISTNVYWLTFAVQMSDSMPLVERNAWLLEIGHPVLDTVYVYWQDSAGAWQKQNFGDAFPISTRPIFDRNFLLPLRHADTSVHRYFIRIASGSSIQIPLTLYKSEVFRQTSIYAALGFGVYFGAMVILAVYNLFLGFALRHRSYFYYAAFILGVAVFFAYFSGYLSQYVVGEYPSLSHSIVPSSITISIMLLMFFSMEFLQTRERSRLLHSALQGILLLSVVLLAVFQLLSPQLNTLCCVALTTIGPLATFIASIVCWRTGNRSAPYLLLAMLMFLLGNYLNNVISLGFTYRHPLTGHLAEIGSLCEGVLLSFALADRYRALRQEKEAAQYEALRVQKEATEHLEEKVHERTLELEESNSEIRRQMEILDDQAHTIELSNVSLQEKNMLLEKHDHEKNELISIVAHDLKNPLTSIRMNASMIRSYRERLTNEKLLETAERIESTSERMHGIIMSLLDSHALETGAMQMTMTQFPLAPLVDEVVQEYITSAAQKNIRLSFEASIDARINAVSALVLADKAKLREVIENLVSNAVKYSPRGKNVWVRVGHSSLAIGRGEGHSSFVIGHWSNDNLSRKTTADAAHTPNDQWLMTNDCLRIEVQDEGPGISEEDMKKLFGKFARLSARPTGGEHSTGLGLSIVKKMVEAMNGKVWCESELGNGATFIVEFWAVSS
ncbi:MAG: ATP-binding protein [Candidatus Kapabacteria bacterium]|jgi:signal transduction histidine kinase|nr:ATP-binding protein [Candidatus Kapabacteria bacterium]